MCCKAMVRFWPGAVQRAYKTETLLIQSDTEQRESRGVETGDEGRERERAVCCEEMAFMIGEGCLMWHCGAVTAL